ncbi:MAG: flagellar hook-associated protein FlgK [Firmicutes bacterium]|nr:flagellar hook-associated protein FlgK [Bacillota bacterium]
MSTFRSLQTVRTGLDAARRAMDIVGRNVANANTAGYSRQLVSFQAAEPSQVILSAGRGISEVNVLRYRDEFVDRQFRSRSSLQGYQETRSQQLSQAEQILGNLSDTGLRTAMDQFFNAWQTLATNPSQPFARSQVVSTAEQFLSQADGSFQELKAMRTDLDTALQTKAADINSAAGQVADLNQAISLGNLTQQETNDLQDRRDLLLDSLAKLAGVTSAKQSDGSVSVYLGSLPLVEKNSAHPISWKSGVEADLDKDPALTSTQQSVTTYTWNGTTTPAVFPGGEMKALMELRDQGIPDYMKTLDTLVRTVATQVNNVHNGGDPTVPDIFTIKTNGAGQPFWMGIELNAVIRQSPDKILAGNPPSSGVPPAPGDGERARQIGNLRDAAILTGGPVGTKQVNPGEYLRSFTAQVGLQLQDATRSSDSATLQVTQAETNRQSVSGVSLDEEMSKMVQFQQAYNASARMMTTIDDMLDLMINRTGMVGR